MFKEIKRTGKLNVSRFVFRRGFKIWPQFYFMILIIPLLQYSAGKLTGNTFVEFNRDYLTGFKGELTMLQNYFGNIYGVTWSLAVEEHFYVLLPLLLFAGLSSGLVKKIGLGNYVIALSVLMFLFSTYCKYNSIVVPVGSEQWRTFQSQIRMDAMFFGVLLAYLNTYKKEALFNFCNSAAGRVWLPVFFILGVSFGTYLLLNHSGFLHNGQINSYFSTGTILVNFAFMAFVVSAYNIIWFRKFLRLLFPGFLFRFIAWCGVYSYAFYLWHRSMFQLVEYVFRMFLPADLAGNQLLVFITGMATAMATGVLLTQTLENYFLKIRDKMLPSDRSLPV